MAYVFVFEWQRCVTYCQYDIGISREFACCRPPFVPFSVPALLWAFVHNHAELRLSLSAVAGSSMSTGDFTLGSCCRSWEGSMRMK